MPYALRACWCVRARVHSRPRLSGSVAPQQMKTGDGVLAPSIESWLGSIKNGYSKFAGAFEAVGIDDVSDVQDPDQGILSKLSDELSAGGHGLIRCWVVCVPHCQASAALGSSDSEFLRVHPRSRPPGSAHYQRGRPLESLPLWGPA